MSSLRLRYALLGLIVIFLFVASMSSSNVFACGGYYNPCPPPPKPHGQSEGGNLLGSTLVVHVEVIVSVVVISHVTDTIPVLQVINQLPPGPPNISPGPTNILHTGAELYGLIVSALAMLGAAAGFGFYQPMFDVPANVNDTGAVSPAQAILRQLQQMLGGGASGGSVGGNTAQGLIQQLQQLMGGTSTGGGSGSGSAGAILQQLQQMLGGSGGSAGGSGGVVLKDALDSASEISEMESLRLQMAMDRISKMMSTLSNVLKAIWDTVKDIVGNLK